MYRVRFSSETGAPFDPETDSVLAATLEDAKQVVIGRLPTCELRDAGKGCWVAYDPSVDSPTDLASAVRYTCWALISPEPDVLRN